MSIDSDDEWSLEALDEDVEVFIGVADIISVDIPLEGMFDEGVDCTTVEGFCRWTDEGTNRHLWL